MRVSVGYNSVDGRTARRSAAMVLLPETGFDLRPPGGPELRRQPSGIETDPLSAGGGLSRPALHDRSPLYSLLRPVLPIEARPTMDCHAFQH